ncbi:hypothetical protein SS50377_20336 [Spironucleus salmonicida]|uniref:Ubiquitin-like domain-containing protein n=1 Tax=Spironucleus salmonicida TaxID=348837 RepID=V6LEU4_9EUKA|nr:hypothetical protein SS50377_20336 [Spironucleus salmonicida]|eukprot:EST43017.1 Hypothetical protein SS50377_17320 [Spironucleus salmonicida]
MNLVKLFTPDGSYHTLQFQATDTLADIKLKILQKYEKQLAHSDFRILTDGVILPEVTKIEQIQQKNLQIRRIFISNLFQTEMNLDNDALSNQELSARNQTNLDLLKSTIFEAFLIRKNGENHEFQTVLAVSELGIFQLDDQNEQIGGCLWEHLQGIQIVGDSIFAIKVEGFLIEFYCEKAANFIEICTGWQRRRVIAVCK